MPGAHDEPFFNGFGRWFATTKLNDIISFAPSPDSDAVEINFLIGGGAIQGYAHPAGISVSAMREGECWDFLFDRDVAIQDHLKGWFCTLCLAEDRSHFASVEALLQDHLFRPFDEWITTQLIPANAIGFYGGDGVTWAKLIADVQADDPPPYIVMLI